MYSWRGLYSLTPLGNIETSLPDTFYNYEDTWILTRYVGGALPLLRPMSFGPVLGVIKLIQLLVTRVLLALGHGVYIP